ncbi:GDP-Man:Man(3)GlcNAc(2)-PP-Dol alpha-1,2-mannosyltransferase-like [Diadema antillarum]|uniref:GDP-Man:Man(3)GlcNAc(2)-PP-Dol alpha-1,2-mannosyltransferase-like n=1 Tax=Diadema antillarum TaxID=105358 RepID=UPI003A8B1AC9
MLLLCVIASPILMAVLLYLAVCRKVDKVRQTKLSHLRQLAPDGIKPVTVGFFHPYCNAGGGGERVLWCAVRALQQKYPHINCVVYSGDTDATHEQIIQKARQRFSIILPRPVEFVFLRQRWLVEAKTYPYLTLLGQSIGSMVLGMEALFSFVPDVYIDSMGYAFTLPLFRFFGKCHVACYTHYPTISTDMLSMVAQRTASYNNAGFVARNPVLSKFKLAYYKLFAFMYGVMGARSEVIMVNSSWTYGHIKDIWGVPDRTSIVYPPCDTKEFTSLKIIPDEEKETKIVASVAQFRPEKDHALQVKSFAKLLTKLASEERDNVRLELIGGCRNEGDESRVEALRNLCKDLGVEQSVDFILNIPFDDLKAHLAGATIGIHTMWNEHFGIGVVECLAAGNIVIAHNSGGPKMDIVVPYEDQPTGFLADTEEGYADAMLKVLRMTTAERMKIREAARKSVSRFSESEFDQAFLAAAEPLFL